MIFFLYASVSFFPSFVLNGVFGKFSTEIGETLVGLVNSSVLCPVSPVLLQEYITVSLLRDICIVPTIEVDP